MLTPRWAVTAAHCVQHTGASSLYVMGGFLGMEEKRGAQSRLVDRCLGLVLVRGE